MCLFLLLFLVYINDIMHAIPMTDTILYVDDIAELILIFISNISFKSVKKNLNDIQ